MYDIEARVIQVWDDKQTVVLNAGDEQGVQAGDEFVIFAEGDRIVDPETDEDYGPLEWVKARVYVQDVMPKNSTAKTRPMRMARRDWSQALESLGGGIVETPTTFDVDDTQTTHHQPPSLAVVPGDKARRWLPSGN